VVNKRLLEKLSVATVPADALETTRHLLKIVVKDTTFAAYGLTKDALITSRLVLLILCLIYSFLPSLQK
jgi:hypothetical protein